MESYKVMLGTSLFWILSIELTLSINGSFIWGSWSSWTSCSRSCGVGVRIRQRACLHHTQWTKRLADNKLCLGESDVYKVCPLQPCMVGFDDDREYQCYNRTNHKISFRLKGRNSRWVAKVAEFTPCFLFCSPQGYHSYWSFGNVSDGTICWPHKSGICIKSQCMSVGCDGTTSSIHQLDKCLVCGGKNDSCQFYGDQYRQRNMPDLVGYTTVATIPTGATNLLIEDKNVNVIALQDSSAFLVLNAYRLNNFDTSPHLSDAGLQYFRSFDNKGRISLIGPTKDDITIMVLQRKRPIEINFEYWWSSRKERILPQIKKDNSDMSAKPTIGPKTAEPTHKQKDGVFNGKRKKIKNRNNRKDCTPEKGRTRHLKHDRRHRIRYQFCHSDSVIRVTVVTRATNGALFRYIVIIRETYHSRIRLSRQEFLWSDAKSCDVPFLREGRDYLLMLNSKADTSRRKGLFLLETNTYAKKWTKKREKLVKSLLATSRCHQ